MSKKVITITVEQMSITLDQNGDHGILSVKEGGTRYEVRGTYGYTKSV